MSDKLSVKIGDINDAEGVLRVYYKTVRATPKIRLPSYARNHLYDNIVSEMNSEDADRISRWQPTPAQKDDMYYVDYYWMPLLSDNEQEFLRLKIGKGLADDLLYSRFPFSRVTYGKWIERCMKYFVDFENGKTVKKQRNRRYFLK